MAKKEVKQMNIQVTKLREALELLKPAVPKKSTLKVTAFIRLGEGKAIATDLETMVIADLPEATEAMLLPFVQIAEMLKYVPGHEMLKMEAKGKLLSLSWPDGNASYPTESVADFPVLPDMPVKAEGPVDGDTLMPALEAALAYAATDDNRPVLSGVTLVLGNPVEVASGDGFRMSHQVLGLSFPLEVKIIIPAHAVAILEHVFAKTPRTPPSTADSLIKVITAKRQLHMALFGDSKVRLDFGTSASVVVNLIVGNPPAWLQLIPKGEPTLQSQLFAPQLEAAAKRVRTIAKDGSGIVRLEFAGGKLKVSAKGDDQEISATMDALNTQGEPGRTALDQKYLIGYLSGKQGIVIFSKYTDTGPVVFQYQNSPRVLIMPMAVQWGDETPPPAVKAEPQAEATGEKSDAEPSEEPESSTEEENTEQETGEEEPVTTE
jgi:DNA polymerase III sliding clamp (beta) subunit (PCNA family)